MPNINEISDEDLSLWIAKRLGYRKAAEGQLSDHWFAPDDQRILEEDLPDFVNDPACTVMLMEKMAGDGGFSMAGSSMGFSCLSMRMGFSDSSGCKEQLGRAVAEAFCLANGWTPTP